MANIMRFVILGDDRGGPAFASFTRQVERANASVDRNNAALKRQTATSKKARGEVDRLATALDGLKKGPALLGPALALAPAIATLSGVAAGAAAGLGGAFAAAAGALAGFGAVAKPVLTDAKKAAETVGKAQAAYNTAIGQGVPKAKAYKAEQAAIAKAYAGMSPQQVALSKQLGAMAGAWDKVKKAETPVVAGALQPWLASVTDLMGKLKPIIDTIAPVIKDLGDKFRALVNSQAATRFRDFVASFGAWSVSAAGSTIIDFFQAFMIILPQFAPLIGQATEGIGKLGPAVVKWASSKKTADQIQAFMAWFNKNGHVVGDLIKNIGKAVAQLAPGLASGGALELKVISDFLGLVAKLPKGVAGPLAEVAGAALVLSKIPGGTKVINFVVSGALGGIFGKKGGATAATVAESAAAGAGAGGLMGKLLGVGAKLVGAAFVVDVLLNFIPSGPSRGPGARSKSPLGLPQAFESPFGLPGPHDKGSANNWLTSWSPYLNRFKQNFSGMTSFVSGSWSKTASFLHGSWSQTVNYLSGSWTKLGQFIGGVLHAVSGAWNATWGALKGAFRVFVVNGVLGPLGWIIHGAAAAFGWVPGLGGKLKGAAKQFDVFAASVNKSLGGINDKTVRVSVAMTSKSNPYPGGISGRAAAGMYVAQGTGPTADDVLIRASRGELIVPANMVRAGAVDHLRGTIPGFAGGGVTVSARTPSPAAVESTLMGSVMTLAQAFAKAAAVAGSSVPGGGGGAARWATQILTALAMLGQPGSLLGAVEHRMNQESGGNPFAVNRWDSNWAAGTPSVGVMQVIGPTYASNSPAGWRNLPPMAYGVSEDVLANTYAGLHHAITAYPGRSLASVMLQSGGYDRGGYLPAGWSLAYNGTGSPEPVGAAAGGGNTYNITVNVPPTASRADTGRVIVEHIREYERSSGTRWRA